MKLLFVIPTLKDGGAERAISNITTHLPDDVEADILINSISDHDFPTDANIICLGMPASKNMGILYQLAAMLRRIHKLKKLKRKNRYDACISFMDSANVANVLSGIKYTKVIGSVHTSVQRASVKSLQYKYIVSPLIRLLYNKSDAIVAVSTGIKKELVEGFGLSDNKVFIIENGCDISALKEQAEESWDAEDNLLEGKRIIITAGRLSEEKGQWHLIRAFGRIAEEEKNAVLVILGAGPLENYLKQAAIQCGIQDKVIFKGFVQNPYKYIAKADGFILSSLYEGYPCAMMEAVCLGIPCIATDFQTGAREILAPELVGDKTKIENVYPAQYGILTPVCSGKQYEGKEELEKAEIRLAESIKLLLDDEEMRKQYALKSMEKSEELKIENIVKRWMDLVKISKGDTL